MTDKHRSADADDETNDAESTDEQSNGTFDRRTLLKGTAVAGLAGTGLAGNASAWNWKEITFCSANSKPFVYFARVSGNVRRGGTYESDDGDEVGENYVKGASADGRCDSFKFTGEIKQLRLDGPGKVFVDGKLVRDTTSKSLPNTITVQAKGETVDYKFRVSGQVEKGEFANSGDRIDGNVVSGTVGGKAKDTYRYSGAIAFDTADGPLTVTLDIDGN